MKFFDKLRQRSLWAAKVEGVRAVNAALSPQRVPPEAPLVEVPFEDDGGPMLTHRGGPPADPALAAMLAAGFRPGDLVLWWGTTMQIVGCDMAHVQLLEFDTFAPPLSDIPEWEGLRVKLAPLDVLAAHQRPWRYDKALGGWVPDEKSASDFRAEIREHLHERRLEHAALPAAGN